LTEKEVDDLVERYQSGVPIRALAEYFGVHRSIISAQLKSRGALVKARQLSAQETADGVGPVANGCRRHTRVAKAA
jgi:hypothetical protein